MKRSLAVCCECGRAVKMYELEERERILRGLYRNEPVPPPTSCAACKWKCTAFELWFDEKGGGR